MPPGQPPATQKPGLPSTHTTTMRFPGLTPDESRLLIFLFVAFAFGLGVKAWRGAHAKDATKTLSAEIADATR